MSNIVVKHNDLISASYRLSLTEQRIILNCISKIRSDLTPDNKMFTVTVDEFSELHGIKDKSSLFFEIRDAVESLWDRYLTVGYGDDRKEHRWIITKQVNDSNQRSIGLEFHPSIMPYLAQLKTNFTKYNITCISRITSAHAIRLYEMLAERQFQNNKRFTVTVAELRERFRLTNTHSLFGDLNARVLKPSIKQINEHSNFDVAVKMIKEGRKVTALRFEFSVKKGQEATRDPAKNPNKVVTAKEVDQNARPGETRKQAADRIKKEKAGIKGLKQALRK